MITPAIKAVSGTLCALVDLGVWLAALLLGVVIGMMALQILIIGAVQMYLLIHS